MLPIIVQKKIKRNDEKIELITKNDDNFAESKQKRLNRRIRFIETNLNKITNIQVLLI